MKGYSAACMVLTLLLISISFPVSVPARRIGKPHSRHGHHHATTVVGNVIRKDEAFVKVPENSWDTTKRGGMIHKRADTLQIAGSSLPDCSHACGSCNPCRLVMVSFVCASLEEAETCPMAYKCMCRNKSYPVP
ncbi:OLC1v1024035C1 [Oldenlandia corymbosa var. corymbosa]|uniref:Epidermal patterning factor-like protein n=1 Tax=Oldenlandia corymbosa var. corymbosa TaxID=529605 RepID=A0AAV1C1R8_OLDCO|nr:OLC1v1024035C1 [Oldenlandia corymbosa var. corymbosa]